VLAEPRGHLSGGDSRCTLMHADCIERVFNGGGVALGVMSVIGCGDERGGFVR